MVQELNRHLTKKDTQITNKHVKNYTVYLTYHEEVKIKATMRYHYAPTRMTKSETLITPRAGKDVQQQELLFIAGRNLK